MCCCCTPSGMALSTSPMIQSCTEQLLSKIPLELMMQVFWMLQGSPLSCDQQLSSYMGPWRGPIRWAINFQEKWHLTSTWCILNVQILETMPAAFFLPVGQPFVEHNNCKFNSNWADEFAGYCFGYFVYLCCVSQYNSFHPKFHRSAPADLQARVLSTKAKYYFEY